MVTSTSPSELRFALLVNRSRHAIANLAMTSDRDYEAVEAVDRMVAAFPRHAKRKALLLRRRDYRFGDVTTLGHGVQSSAPVTRQVYDALDKCGRSLSQASALALTRW